MADIVLGAVVCVYLVISVNGIFSLFEQGPPRPYIGKLRLKADISKKLINEPGKDLVLVSYSPEHNSHEEWVYNRADIDSANIVWARDLGPSKNQRLFDYFEKRAIWVLYPDRKPISLNKLKDANP